MSDLSQEIRSLRDERGETQSQFGQHFGVDQSTVCRWERGAAPDLPTLRSIAGLKGSSIEDLLGIGPKSKSTSKSASTSTPASALGRVPLLGRSDGRPQNADRIPKSSNWVNPQHQAAALEEARDEFGADKMSGAPLDTALGSTQRTASGDHLEAPLVGRVQAGAFLEAEAHEEAEILHFSLTQAMSRAMSRFAPYGKQLFEVAGDSMDKLYPAGSLLVTVPYAALGREVQEGDRAVIQAVHSDGRYEATVKTIRVRNGALWACPESYNPAHHAINLTETGAEEIQAIAIVVASWRPEILEN